MNSTTWSTQQLAEFLEIFHELDESTMYRVAIDRIAESLDAEVAAYVADGHVIHQLGIPPRVDAGRVAELAHQPHATVNIAQLGTFHHASAPIDAERRCLVVLRMQGQFEREELILLRSMGRALSLAITAEHSLRSSRILADQLIEHHQLNAKLARIQRKISHRAPLQEVLDGITSGAAQLLDAEVAGLRVEPLREGDHVHSSIVGYGPQVADKFARLPLEYGFIGQAYLENRLVATTNFDAEPSRRSRNEAHRLRVSMAAPVHHNGEPVGVLNVASSKPHRVFTVAEQETLLALAEHASLAVNDAAAISQLRATLAHESYRARHDLLTGLLNRNGMVETLDNELARMKPNDCVALFFVDLDRFKTFNDMFGHDFGDKVLTETAMRIQAACRNKDTVARLAGDEFVVLAPRVAGAKCEQLARRIESEVAKPLTIAGREISLECSIGYVVSDSSRSGQSLLVDADLAMYRAKRSSRGHIVEFNHSMRSEMVARAETEREISRAIHHDEFVAYFQPYFDLRTDQIIGFEALARWNHPDRGLLGADQFIEIAEATGQIVEIDRQILAQACRQLTVWNASGSDLYLSANLSPRHFGDPRLTKSVSRLLSAHRLEPHRICLEITERVMMDDAEPTLVAFAELERLGVRFAIDDFGTGYSSLSYLRRFHVHQLKIDRSFVSGIGDNTDDEAIVSAIVSLAQTLGHTVVAEGIETEMQRAFLARLGCSVGQGYLCSPAIDAASMTELLASRRAGRTDAGGDQIRSALVLGR